MAFMQPENIVSRNDVPGRLQSVAAFLRDFMPDDVTVWLERTGDGEVAALRREFERTSRPDADGNCYLVVLDPSCGIAVIESPTLRQVRSWGRRRTELNQNFVRTEIAQRVKSLLEEAQRLSLEALPVRHVIGLPDIARIGASNLETRLPLLVEEDFAPNVLPRALSDAIGGSVLPFEDSAASRGSDPTVGDLDGGDSEAALGLTIDQVAAARAAVRPDIVIGGRAPAMFRSPDPASEEVIRHAGPRTRTPSATPRIGLSSGARRGGQRKNTDLDPPCAAPCPTLPRLAALAVVLQSPARSCVARTDARRPERRGRDGGPDGPPSA